MKIVGLGIVFFLIFGIPSAWAELNLEQLSDSDILKVKKIIAKLEPFIQKHQKQKDHTRLTFVQLYAPLTRSEKDFLKQFEHLDAKALGVKIPFRGLTTGQEDLVMIVGQKVKVRAEERKKTKSDTWELPPQYLPREVYEQYLQMMDRMEADIGKRLFVESGYRSSAYQLYLFVYYLQNHKYSIRETVKFVALPGFSEHGAPEHQAIDFVNADGINGEYNPPEFEALPEYEWLLKNAGRFGFVLSYPKNAAKGITYEPWHWRYERP